MRCIRKADRKQTLRDDFSSDPRLQETLEYHSVPANH